MKRTRIVPSTKPVTTIRVNGKDHHYFHSDVHGLMRGIIISPDENLPSPAATKEQLYSELDGLLAYLPFIPLTDDWEFEQTLNEIRRLKNEIIAIESK